MRLSLLTRVVVLTLILFSCTSPQHSGEDDNMDHEMYLVAGLDHGLLQSPINILSSEAHDEEKHNITLNFNGVVNKIENLGHTVQLDIEPGNTITLDGKEFEFKQLHFHTPSEHLIDGMTFPMEMHVVNMREVPGSDTPEYLVISFLIKMGQENPFIKSFSSDIPQHEDEVKDVNLHAVKESIFFKDDLDGIIQSCYHYKGSLTTPPYTESVYWLIHKQIFEASPEQIEYINQLEGDNARHIQAINDRTISD